MRFIMNRFFIALGAEYQEIIGTGGKNFPKGKMFQWPDDFGWQ